MNAIVVHQYGDPDVLKYEEYPDPVAGPGEVLVQVAAEFIAYSPLGVSLTQSVIEGTPGAQRPMAAFLPPEFTTN